MARRAAIPDRPRRIWLVTAGEPLAVDGPTARLYRTGQVAIRLRRLGVDVTWWSSTFDHSAKRQRMSSSTPVTLDDGTRLWLLHGRSYGKNISLARILNHREMAREFQRLAVSEPRPDLIAVSWPTPEFAAAVTKMATTLGIPSVVDLRDLWPDIFVDVFPKVARPPARVALEPLFQQARRTLGRATGLVAISDPILEWGLNRAHRARRPADRVFHLSYDPDRTSRDPTAEESFWTRPEMRGLRHRFIVCFIGSITRRIELGPVIQAAELLQERGRDDVGIVVAGVGESRAELVERSKGLNNIAFPGWLDAAEIRHVMNRAQLGLLPYPSTKDFVRSFPNKIGEYLSAGLAILSSTEGLVAEMLDHERCGYRYQARSPESLATTIEQAFSDPTELASRRASARRVFAERFDADRVYGDYAEYLIELAGDGGI